MKFWFVISISLSKPGISQFVATNGRQLFGQCFTTEQAARDFAKLVAGNNPTWRVFILETEGYFERDSPLPPPVTFVDLNSSEKEKI